jgi:ABC-type antimicrobial peptide transport system permease subunit
MTVFFKALGIVFLASVKLLFAPFTALASGFDFFEAAALSAIGGVIGITFFFWMSELLANTFKSKEGRKKFTRINKFIVRMKHKIGMKGLAFIGPPFLSVPISSAIMAKFYRHQPVKAYTYLCLSVVFWSFLLSTISFLF